MTAAELFYTHLSSGITTVCRAWDVTRTDGAILGFTDHDVDLSFDGVTYLAGGGMTARTFEQSTGLAVDNSEAIGVLSDQSITEEDINGGRFDAAPVRFWQVNWKDPSQRVLIFRGTLGEIERSSVGFRAELRGLSEALNRERGHVFQAACSAVLGDKRCKLNTDDVAYSVVASVEQVVGGGVITFSDLGVFADRWFERGAFEVVSGDASGFTTVIKNDRSVDGARQIELWDPVPRNLRVSDSVRLIAGCDKRIETCRSKFSNTLNFRGFPSIPGDDWLVSYPKSGGDNDGGSLR